MAAKKPAEPLQGGTFEKVDTDRLRSDIGGQLSTYVDLKINALDAKLGGEMTGLQREVSAKLDSKPSIGAMILNTAVGIGIVLAIFAFGGDRFDGGMSASGAYAQYAVERERREADLDRQLNEIKNQLDTLQQQKDARK